MNIMLSGGMLLFYNMVCCILGCHVQPLPPWRWVSGNKFRMCGKFFKKREFVEFFGETQRQKWVTISVGWTWLGHSRLKEPFPILFSLSSNQMATVANFRDGHGWNIPFKTSMTGNLTVILAYCNNMTSLLRLMQPWTISNGKEPPKGAFTVRSCYTLLETCTYSSVALENHLVE